MVGMVGIEPTRCPGSRPGGSPFAHIPENGQGGWNSNHLHKSPRLGCQPLHYTLMVRNPGIEPGPRASGARRRPLPQFLMVGTHGNDPCFSDFQSDTLTINVKSPNTLRLPAPGVCCFTLPPIVVSANASVQSLTRRG